MIGSILTKRYRNDADLDINILFDVPGDKQELERLRLSKKYLSAKTAGNVQGKLIPGSEHPINFYFITDKETYEDQNKKADAVFDIETDKFVKRPEDFSFDTGLYIKDFEKKVQELDVIKGNLKRDIIDYDELTELNPDDILNLQDRINTKLEEIEDSCNDIAKIGDGIDADRRTAFDKDMTPDQIHEKLINKVKSVPANDYKIYLSRSEDPKKNPLSPRTKLDVMKKIFPSHARNIEINTTNMILDICTKLYNQGYTDVNMVVGSDRVREFETIIKKYNDVKSRHGYYNFDNIKVVSAGERDPDAEGATGMSASKMRAAAAKGDLESFKRGLPRNADAEKIFKDVRKGMNLAANYLHMPVVRPIASMEEFEQQQIRDMDLGLYSNRS